MGSGLVVLSLVGLEGFLVARSGGVATGSAPPTFRSEFSQHWWDPVRFLLGVSRSGLSPRGLRFA